MGNQTENIYNRRNSISEEEKASQNIQYIRRSDATYPVKLDCIPSAPKGVYVTGRLPDPEEPSVAIIGARVCSENGRQMACQFGNE